MKRTDSIIQSKKECLACKTTCGLHSHHVFYGSDKPLSEKYGLKIWLCGPHHNLSDEGIHFDREFDFNIKQLAQEKFEEIHGLSFLKVFGRNYLGITFDEYMRGR